MRALVVLLAVFALTACSLDEPRPTTDQSPLDALIAFARAPSDASWDALPLAETVSLGLADELVAERDAEALRDDMAWRITRRAFRGATGSFSALELIAREDGRLKTSVGSHAHCVSRPVPPPRRVAELTRLSVQPTGYASCLAWWTVDVFVNDNGEIEAVTLDLWEP